MDRPATTARVLGKRKECEHEEERTSGRGSEDKVDADGENSLVRSSKGIRPDASPALFQVKRIDDLSVPLTFAFRPRRARSGSTSVFRHSKTSYLLKRPSSCPVTLECTERVKKRKVSHHFFRSPSQLSFAPAAAPSLLSRHRPARSSNLRPDEGVWLEEAASIWHHVAWRHRSPSLTPEERRSRAKDRGSVIAQWRKRLERMRNCALGNDEASNATRKPFVVRPSSFEPDDPRCVKEQLLAMLRARSGESGSDSSRKFLKWVFWNAWVSKKDAVDVCIDDDELEHCPSEIACESEAVDAKCITLDDPAALVPFSQDLADGAVETAAPEPVVLMGPIEPVPMPPIQEDHSPQTLAPASSSVAAAVASSDYGRNTFDVSSLSTAHSYSRRPYSNRRHVEDEQQHGHDQHQQQQQQSIGHKSSWRMLACQG